MFPYLPFKITIWGPQKRNDTPKSTASNCFSKSAKSRLQPRGENKTCSVQKMNNCLPLRKKKTNKKRPPPPPTRDRESLAGVPAGCAHRRRRRRLLPGIQQVPGAPETRDIWTPSTPRPSPPPSKRHNFNKPRHACRREQGKSVRQH